MEPSSKAEQDLRVIRTLMERATLYRAISAPTALLGGLLSIAAASAIYWNNGASVALGKVIRGRDFATIWIGVLVITLAANTIFIWKEARKSGRPFISSGMKLAVRAIAPCLLVPAAFTSWFYSTGYLGAAELDLVVVWVVFYGLALLSTSLFAPQSLTVLGWAFLLSGLAVPAVNNLTENLSVDLPLVTMGATFGLYHLIYAAATWSSRSAGQQADAAFE